MCGIVCGVGGRRCAWGVAAEVGFGTRGREGGLHDGLEVQPVLEGREEEKGRGWFEWLARVVESPWRWRLGAGDAVASGERLGSGLCWGLLELS